MDNETRKALNSIFKKDPLPLWCGIPKIYHKFNGCWNDPYIIYKNYVFNEWDVWDSLQAEFDDIVKEGNEGFKDVDDYVLNNQDAVYNLLDDMIFGKCYIKKLK